jgi:hypothetical protein
MRCDSWFSKAYVGRQVRDELVRLGGNEWVFEVRRTVIVAV